jgi:putative membrane protein
MKKIILLLSGIVISNYMNSQAGITQKDKDFVKEAGEGGLMEVKLGELAQSKGTSSSVMNLGKSMVEDHTKANNELKQLASAKNIPFPTTLSEKGQKAYDRLSKKDGKAFDKAYTHCMVKDHKKDICAFKKEAKKGDDKELKTWASNIVPTLEHHKEMAKEACKSVRKS